MGKEPGVVHGAVYRNAFGESMKYAEVVGEGFSFCGNFKSVSGSFNNPEGSEYHDKRDEMSRVSDHCMRKIVDYWKEGGSCWTSRKRNFEVKELLKDYEA
jgi:hypothetical protein